MRKLVSIVSLMFICCFAGAQNISFSSPNAESQKLLDSIKYVLPEFASGMVLFSNGQQSHGALNINTIDQRVHFIDSKGAVLALTDNDKVSKVFIKGRTFMKNRNGYIEILESTDDVVMGVYRSVSFLSEDKEGAFGSKSQTSSIQTVNAVQSDGYMIDFEKNRNSPYIYKQVPYVCRKGLFYPVSKKVLYKCFPNKKEAIDKYIDENKVNMGNVAEVREMFKAINQ